MTIDERLEKLVERHEALTQTVALIAMENRGVNALVREIGGGIRDLVAAVRSHEQRISNLKS